MSAAAASTTATALSKEDARFVFPYVPFARCHSSLKEWKMADRFKDFDFSPYSSPELPRATLELCAAHVAAGEPVSSGPHIFRAPRQANQPSIPEPAVASIELPEEKQKVLFQMLKDVRAHW